MAKMSDKQASAYLKALGWLKGVWPTEAHESLKTLSQREDLDPCDVSVLVGDVMALAYDQHEDLEYQHKRKLEVLDILIKHQL